MKPLSPYLSYTRFRAPLWVPLLILTQAGISTYGVPVSKPEMAAINDNTRPSGRLRGDTLVLALETRAVLWKPAGADGPAVPVLAFAEAGRPAAIPAPLIRVPKGTPIRVTIRNVENTPLKMRGLQDHGGAALDTVVVAPGESHVFSFTATAPGTFFYWGQTESTPTPSPVGYVRDAGLIGAFIVDESARRPRDRVLLVTLVERPEDTVQKQPRRVSFLVNGLAWPYTERMHHMAGDTVRWRVINASPGLHPMHLHGFYFAVTARGTARADTIYTRDAPRLAVTESMLVGTTMAMKFVPTRPGNWLFHCHLARHITGGLREAETTAAHPSHAMKSMAGLITGIHVSPRVSRAAPSAQPQRRLRLHVTGRSGFFGVNPGLSYVLQEGERAPATDSLRFPGSTIVLYRNEPTEIVVVNHARESVSVHWHGIEVDSYFDGVAGWSGWKRRVAAEIAAGDSFAVRMTPDRAGTFIYHTHTDEARQLASGLYGPLIVLEPGERLGDRGDVILLLGAGGPDRLAPPLISGSAKPDPIVLDAGRTYRLRFINISPNDLKTVTLGSGGGVATWRPIAKDGADLPPARAEPGAANVAIGAGETYDYEISSSAAKELALQVITRFHIFAQRPLDTTDVVIRFRERP